MSIKRYNIRVRAKWVPIAIITTVLLVSGNFSGCETEDWMLEINCSDCYGFEPDSANLIIRLTINETYDSVPLTFYRGPYEDGKIDWQDTATTEEFYLYSEVGVKYTVKAKYTSGDITIEAFDADNMHLYDAAGDCGSPCYIVKGGIFDVQLMK